MTLARQVDLEETGNGGGPSAHHSRNEEGHPSSATPDLQHQQQQHHQQQHSGGGHHQQVYSTLLAPRYIMRADLYNHKGELDDSSYDSGTFTMFFFAIGLFLTVELWLSLFLLFHFLRCCVNHSNFFSFVKFNFLPLDG